jgi:hypothetical protein
MGCPKIFSAAGASALTKMSVDPPGAHPIQMWMGFVGNSAGAAKVGACTANRAIQSRIILVIFIRTSSILLLSYLK